MPVTRDQFQGCLLGLALGDALGAPFEGGILERCLWRAIGTTRNGEMRWTDDTQMSIDIVESFLARRQVDPDDLSVRFAKSYRWSRGYGPGTARMLKRISRGVDWRTANRSVYPNGSFGNGAAMRASIVGLIYAHRADELADAVHRMGAVTHAHTLGLEGAVLLASVTEAAARACHSRDVLQQAASCCRSEPFVSRLAIAQAWLDSDTAASSKEVARQLGNGIAAHNSCVTAVYLALRFREQAFLDMQRFAVAIGGDVDTIGAMAGAVWGAANGFTNLPAESLKTLERQQDLIDLAAALHQHLSIVC